MSIVRIATAWVGSLLLVASTTAQPAAGPVGGRPPGPGPGGAVAGGGQRGAVGVGFGAQNRQKQLAAIRDQLGAGEDDWKALSPKVEKVLVAKQNTSTGAGMSWTSANNAKPVVRASDATPDTAPGRAMQEVRDAAADRGASDEELSKKVAAVREARRKARAQYEAAQKELTDALTPRQQAILMTLGVVE